MVKRVLVIASGETERRALPHMTRHLNDQDVLVDVRTPPRHRPLNATSANEIIRSCWFEGEQNRPDKFVILVDVDKSKLSDILDPIRTFLFPFLKGIKPSVPRVLTAYARQHLEAWCFADVKNLRSFLGRDPGQVDASRPDEIENPKRHLQNLLGETIYTAQVSGEIAGCLDARTVVGRSPSFKGFLDAVLNGDALPARLS